MIIGFIGGQRQGKTLLMTFFSHYYFKNGFNVVSNQKSLSFKSFYFDSEMLKSSGGLMDLKKKTNNKKLIIAIDEAHLMLDSRKSNQNSGKSFLLTQAGKMLEEQGHFFYSTQFFNQIDLRLRMNTALLFHCEKVIDEKTQTTLIKTTLYAPKFEKMLKIKELYFNADVIFNLNLYDTHELIDYEGDLKK